MDILYIKKGRFTMMNWIKKHILRVLYTKPKFNVRIT